jgi:hypothetical protein
MLINENRTGCYEIKEKSRARKYKSKILSWSYFEEFPPKIFQYIGQYHRIGAQKAPSQAKSRNRAFFIII